ncbi:MAG: hypothetical protein L3K15_06830 [Thermoplasmata archaeon]|nr:hypothetical protein [Thermoplasmata archaeon]
MAASPRKKHAVPIALGLGMLGVIIAAGLSPNTGAAPAQTTCPYGVCPTASNGIASWEIALVVIILLAAALLAVLLLRRRNRGGPPGEAPSGAMGPSIAGGPGMTPLEPPIIAPYVETPEDIGAPPVAPPAPPVPPPTDGEGDIDSLLKELDTISGEILKRGAPTKTPPVIPDSGGSPPPS